MLNTLEKVKRLEQYLGFEESANDPVVDRTVTKLLLREAARMEALRTRLSEQIREFEQRYHLPSAEFYACYERGELGDDMDLIEWASTIEMLANVEKRLAVLESHSLS
jgi:hypothetical protein